MKFGDQKDQSLVIGRTLRIGICVALLVYLVTVLTMMGRRRHARIERDAEVSPEYKATYQIQRPAPAMSRVREAALNKAAALKLTPKPEPPKAAQPQSTPAKAAPPPLATTPKHTLPKPTLPNTTPAVTTAPAPPPKATQPSPDVNNGGVLAETFTKLLEKHKKLQEDVLNGRIPLTRAIIARCGPKDICAGLGDRLFGIAALYVGAILTDRAFFIDYTKPKPMENYMVPNRFEWRISAINDSGVRDKVKGCSDLKDNFDSCNFINLLMPGAQCPHVMNAVFSSKNFVVINIDHRTECVQKMLVKQGVVPPKGLNGFTGSPENMRQWAANVTSIMFRTLFRPKEEIAAAVDKALMPKGFTAPVLPDCLVCIHVRSGGGVGERGRHTNWKDFASCGLKAHDALLKSHTCPQQPPWLIVGDSKSAPSEIMANVDAKRRINLLSTTDLGPPVHMDQNNQATDDMVRHVFIDWFLLTHCKYFVASLSTFSGTSSVYGGPSVRRWDMEVGGHAGGCSAHGISDWQRDANIPG